MWSLICVALYLMLALASYSDGDPGWSRVGHAEEVSNAGGRAGAWFSDVALYLFGLGAWLIPAMVAWSAWLVFRRSEPEPEVQLQLLALRWLGFALALTALCGLAAVHFAHLGARLPNGTGGPSGCWSASTWEAPSAAPGRHSCWRGSSWPGSACSRGSLGSIWSTTSAG
jgi:DNA segregation ATPase FtsK/SpoIIIE, S-DNA-T family